MDGNWHIDVPFYPGGLFLCPHIPLQQRGGRILGRKRLQLLLEVAIMGAISFVLDRVGFEFPQGGSITLSMLPIIIMAFRWGIAGGMMTGFISGLLQMVMTGKVYHPVQAGLDYFVAYALVGLAAVTLGWLLKSKAKDDTKSFVMAIVVGTVIGGLLRFFIHFIGGMVFFGQYAAGQPVWLYSLVYNATYMVPSIILCAIVAVLLLTTAPRLLQHK